MFDLKLCSLYELAPMRNQGLSINNNKPNLSFSPFFLHYLFFLMRFLPVFFLSFFFFLLNIFKGKEKQIYISTLFSNGKKGRITFPHYSQRERKAALPFHIILNGKERQNCCSILLSKRQNPCSFDCGLAVNKIIV